MASTERRGNGEAGSRSGNESPERLAIATDEGLQAERLCESRTALVVYETWILSFQGSCSI